MEASRVHQLLEGRVALARQEGDFKIYNVLPQEERRCAEAGYRVMRIGRPNDRPTRCVLLLGETGAGKTTLVNAALNCLFGVEFNDPFRLQVKEETEGGRRSTESQTDAVTVYVIHHQAGMRHEYNCVLIDTPGLADTRGTQRQEAVRSGLEAFLTSEDANVDELHCVGIVAKANVNRDLSFHGQMNREIISLLGDNVPGVTYVLATFATDTPSVDAVMKNTGVRFKRVFSYDNGVLFSPPANADSSNDAKLTSIRWERMLEHHDNFFVYLAEAPSVCTAVIRERKLFDMSKKKLRTQINEVATLMAAYYKDKDIYNKYELQNARNEHYMELVSKVVISLEDPAEGLCAHNCRECRHTCHQCSGSVEIKAVLDALCDAEVVAAIVTGGLILAEPAAVTTSIAELVFTVAAAPGAVAASKAAAATGTETASKTAAATGIETASKTAAATGTETASKTAAATGTETASKTAAATGAAIIATGAGAATGAAVGASVAAAGTGSVATASVSIPLTRVALALLTESAVAAPSTAIIASGAALGAVAALGVAGAGYVAYKALQDPYSCDMDATSGCTRKDCHHSLSDHVRQDKVIKKEIMFENRTNKEKEERYYEAVARKREANGRITHGKQGILRKMTTISQTTVELLYHAKRTQELTSQKRDYVTEVMSHITSGSMQAGQDVTPHAGQLAAVVRQAMQKLASGTAQQVCGSKTLVVVEDMFLGMFRD